MHGAGPARYDRVLVERFGPASARTVLVLEPGSASGAGAFGFVADDLVRRVRGLQVWAVERREHAFEDTSVLERGDPDAALAYYSEEASTLKTSIDDARSRYFHAPRSALGTRARGVRAAYSVVDNGRLRRLVVGYPDARGSVRRGGRARLGLGRRRPRRLGLPD